MKTLFFCSGNLLYLSDILRTEYIKYLSSKYKVIVFLPFSEDIIRKQNYYKNDNIKYVSWYEQNNKFNARIKLLRMSAIRRFDKLTQIRKLMPIYLKGKNRKVKLLFKLSVLLKKVFRLNLSTDFFTKLEIILMPESKIFNNFYKTYEPEMVITASPGFTNIEAEFIILAKQKKIKTVAVDFSWDNLSSNAPRLRKSDYLIVWNNVVKGEALKIHNYNKNHVFVSGILRYDYYFNNNKLISRTDFLLSKGLNPNFKTLLISTVAPGAYNKFDNVLEDIINWRKQKKIRKDLNIFVRLHPKDTMEKYKKFISEENIHLELAARNTSTGRLSGFKVEMKKEDLLNLKHTLMYCDFNLNHCSTISLEACIFDMPVINICLAEKYLRHYNAYHYKPISQSGAVRIAYNNKEVIKLLNLYFNNPETDKDSRAKIVNQYIEYTDGLSYKRSVDFLDKILN